MIKTKYGTFQHWTNDHSTDTEEQKEEMKRSRALTEEDKARMHREWLDFCVRSSKTLAGVKKNMKIVHDKLNGVEKWLKQLKPVGA